jgi:hypothetical protein
VWSLVLIVALLAPMALVSSPPAKANEGEDEDDEPPRGELWATIPWHPDGSNAVEIYARRDGDRVRFTAEVLNASVSECFQIPWDGPGETITDGFSININWTRGDALGLHYAGARVVDAGPEEIHRAAVSALEKGHAWFSGIRTGDTFWIEYEIEPDIDWDLLRISYAQAWFTTSSPLCQMDGVSDLLYPGRFAGALEGAWMPREPGAERWLLDGSSVPVRLRVDNRAGGSVTDVSVDEVEVVSLDEQAAASLVPDTSPDAARPAEVLDGSGPGSVTHDDYLLTGDEPGRVELVAQLSGVDADGQQVTGTVRNEFEVRRVGLRLEVVVPDEPVVLVEDVDGEGVVPAEVDVTLRVSVPEDEEAVVDIGPFEVVEGDGGVSLRVLERAEGGWQEVSPPPVPLPIEVIEGPSPVPIERIEPGESVDLQLKVRITEAAGYQVRATVEGFTEDTEERLLARGEGTFEADAGEVLGIEVEIDPNPVELAVTDSPDDDAEATGFEPQEVTVTARVVNRTEQATFDEVAVPELELVLPTDDEDEEIEAARLLSGPTVEDALEDLGPLGPGESSVEVSWTLEALERGDVEVVVTGTGSGATGEVEMVTTESLEVRGPIVLIDLAPRGVATRPDGSQWAIGGQAWRLEGTVANTSTDETVVVWLDPRFQGNASLGPVASTSHQLPALDEQCPIMPALVIDPEEEVELTIPIRASRVLAMEESSVTLDPRIHVEAVDGEILDAPIVVDEDRWSARRDGVVFDGDIVYEMPVETGRLEVDRDGWELSYLATTTGLEHLGEFFGDMGALAYGAGETLLVLHPGSIDLLDPERVGQFNVAAQFLHNVLRQMTLEERAEFMNGVVDQIYTGTRGLIEDPELRAEIYDAVSGAIGDWASEEWDNFEEDRYYDGDLDAVLERLAKFAGSNPDLAVGVASGGASTLCKLANDSPTVLRSLDRLKALRGEALARWNGTLVASHLLEPGLEVSYRLARQAFGIDRYTWDTYVNAASESGGILMLRRRGLGALQRIDEGAWLKTEAFKSKNVNRTDVDLFGFPEEWLDTAASGRPRPWADVQANPAYANADAPTQADIRKRWEKRMEEMDGNPGERSVLQDLYDMEATSGSEGGGAKFPAESIWKELNLNTDDYAALARSGQTLPPDAANTRWRQVELERVTTPDGREMVRPKVLDDDGVARALTGDMDPVAFLNGEGNAVMDAVARNELYDELADAGVLLHGETQSVVVEKFQRLLSAHVYGVEGNEPLLAFMPDGRAVISWYDPRKSTFTPESLSLEGQGLMFHGVTSKLRAEVDIPNPFPSIPAPLASLAAMAPTRWLVNGGECLVAPADDQAPCSVELTPDPNGKVMRQPHPGHLEIWTRITGWIDYLDYLANPPETAGIQTSGFELAALRSVEPTVRLASTPTLPNPLHLQLQPMTGLLHAVDAGATILPIATEEDWTGFAIGDRIVIDPGGPDEQTRTVMGLAPLSIDQPLDQDLDGGTLLVRDPDSPARQAGGSPGSPTLPPVPPADSPDHPYDLELLTCDTVAPRTFADMAATSVHADNVACAAGLGLFHGRDDGRFQPAASITRGQMATVIDRTLIRAGIELDTPDRHEFEDVPGSVHEQAIARLAANGILHGRTPTRFDPTAAVTRGQLASIIDRTSQALLIGYPDATRTHFPDVTSGTHQQAIDRLARAGILQGTADGRFHPTRSIRRDQAATVLIRWLADQHQRPSPAA